MERKLRGNEGWVCVKREKRRTSGSENEETPAKLSTGVGILKEGRRRGEDGEKRHEAIFGTRSKEASW